MNMRPEATCCNGNGTREPNKMVELVPLATQKPKIVSTTSRLSAADWFDHALVRIGYRRDHHRVSPGLYALGKPTPDSPVFVTSNYTLSFDALRSALKGIDGYILVLDTRGINVWCAAGKGTFGTDEVVRRVRETGLKNVVVHRDLILPQLGASGVTAHEVKKRSGFRVEYGPVRASDLPAYLETRQATPEMRKVRFDLRDRLILVPVEVKHRFLRMLVAAIAFYLMGGWLFALAAVGSVLAGCILFPILIPWLPTRNFSTKGYLLGLAVAVPFVLWGVGQHPNWQWWRQAGQALALLLAMPAATAYLALNFTGATTFTSPGGVRREIFAYIPPMAWTFGTGLVLAIGLAIVRWMGGL